MIREIVRAAVVRPAGRRRSVRVVALAATAAALFALAVAALAARIGSGTLLLDPREGALYRAHGTWRRMFSEDGLVERFPLVFWVLALVVVGLIGLPYVWLAARSLPDRGFALARPVGLLLVTWLVWWAASLRLLAFTRGHDRAWRRSCLQRAPSRSPSCDRAELLAWVRARWRLLAFEEGVFWALFRPRFSSAGRTPISGTRRSAARSRWTSPT